MPIASTSPNSVSVLMEKPSAAKAPNVPMSEMGTTTIGINVARQLCRNRRDHEHNQYERYDQRLDDISFSDSVTNGVVL